MFHIELTEQERTTLQELLQTNLIELGRQRSTSDLLARDDELMKRERVLRALILRLKSNGHGCESTPEHAEGIG